MSESLSVSLNQLQGRLLLCACHSSPEQDGIVIKPQLLLFLLQFHLLREILGPELCPQLEFSSLGEPRQLQTVPMCTSSPYLLLVTIMRA